MEPVKGKRFGRWTMFAASAGILLQTADEGCRQQVEAALFTGVEAFATSVVSALFTASAQLISAFIQAFFLGLANRGGSSPITTVEAIIEQTQIWLA